MAKYEVSAKGHLGIYDAISTLHAFQLFAQDKKIHVQFKEVWIRELLSK